MEETSVPHTSFPGRFFLPSVFWRGENGHTSAEVTFRTGCWAWNKKGFCVAIRHIGRICFLDSSRSSSCLAWFSNGAMWIISAFLSVFFAPNVSCRCSWVHLVYPAINNQIQIWSVSCVDASPKWIRVEDMFNEDIYNNERHICGCQHGSAGFPWAKSSFWKHRLQVRAQEHKLCPTWHAPMPFPFCSMGQSPLLPFLSCKLLSLSEQGWQLQLARMCQWWTWKSTENAFFWVAAM